MEAGGASLTDSSPVFKDGVHPKPKGLTLLIDIVTDQLKQIISSDETIVCFGDSIARRIHPEVLQEKLETKNQK